MLKEYAEIARPINCAMGAMGTVLAVFISGSSSVCGYLIGAAIALLVMAAGNALNDYMDVEIDRIAHPNRPLPSGRMSAKSALHFSILLFALGIVASVPLGAIVIAIVSVNIAFMVLYEAWGKRNPSGNVIISYLVGSLFLFGGAISGSIEGVLVLFFLSFFATLGREMAKGIEDLEGDRGKRKTLAVISLPAAKYLSVTFIATAVALSPLPYAQGLFSEVYLILVAFTDVVFLYSMISVLNGKRASVLMRYGMILALVSFIGGAI
jgi:geranylgeranylglycerol-phosphate geranylgeranyltransferase